MLSKGLLEPIVGLRWEAGTNLYGHLLNAKEILLSLFIVNRSISTAAIEDDTNIRRPK